jgi:hypothetical protein
MYSNILVVGVFYIAHSTTGRTILTDDSTHRTKSQKQRKGVFDKRLLTISIDKGVVDLANNL